MSASPTHTSWLTRPYHRQWLRDQAEALFQYFATRALNPKGGFYDLTAAGEPMPLANPVRGIHGTARMVHCFAIGSLLGRPGSDIMVDHGMQYLWNVHRDAQRGGYFWAVDDNGAADNGRKQGYGHAFVLLAASSARLVGHPLADRMLADVTEIIVTRFWEERHGAIAEEFHADWSPIGPYRGQNSNMHMTEALMAAFEATGERDYLARAERIAELIIHRRAQENGWRVAEHFDPEWRLDRNFAGDQMFRPPGTTPGHSLEWSRLLLQLYALGGKQQSWMPDAAEALFGEAVALGWDKAHGGFFYNLDWNGVPQMRHKLWWPMAEGVGAAAFLMAHRPKADYESWYRRIWDVIARHHLDHRNGGWHEQLSEDMRPAYSLFAGKADLYHALQACLIPLYPAEGSITRGILTAQG
ncbi:MAG TPA: AGE family epimerase/isomerase [Devosia sp.]|nr:AGE family epimerase/isomerase [Devosia sp.]